MTVHAYGIWIRETTATTGTGNVTLAGAMSSYAAFSSQFSTDDRVLYTIKDGVNREIGEGTMVSSTVLARTTPRATLVAGVFDNTSPTSISLSGTAEIACTDDADSLNFLEQSLRFPTGEEGKVLVAGATGTETDWEEVVDGGTWT